MSAYYSYFLEEGEDDIAVYSFLTKAGALYSVYFSPYEYIDYVDAFPNLLRDSYGIGFQRVTGIITPVVGVDTILYATIQRIIKEFIEAKGTQAVLLYHCEYKDGKQRGREKFFSQWYEQSGAKGEFIKSTIEVELPVDKRGIARSTYVGYITSSDNPLLAELQNELDAFASYLVYSK